MRGKKHSHEHHGHHDVHQGRKHGGRAKHREAGGRTPEHDKEAFAGGNPYVEEEAKKKRGGSIHAARAKHHLGKRGRATGGRVGSNNSPLSTAHTQTDGYEAKKHGGRAKHHAGGGPVHGRHDGKHHHGGHHREH